MEKNNTPTTSPPTPVTETTESVSVSTSVAKKTKALYLASIFFALAIIASSVFVYYKKQPVVTPPIAKKEEVKLNYVKTEFKDTPPTDFLKEIPLPTNVSFEQSYGLQYTTAKQLTVVFPSPKTRKENFTLYKDFLTKNKWSIKNSTEGKTVSSLYATKDKNDINVTISGNTTDKDMKSQVSVSVLKR